jgi:hypothetical protein
MAAYSATPTKAHYFFAQKWPIRVWTAGAMLISALAAAGACDPGMGTLTDWITLRSMAWAVVIALLLGWFSSILIGWLVLGPIYFRRALKNGAPFEVGDRVRILAGPYRDRICRVYALWQGCAVRVDLGEWEQRKLRDIFSPTQLLRELET